MTFFLHVERDGTTVLRAKITEIYAKSIALLAWEMPRHLALFPQHHVPLTARLAQLIEAALQVTPIAHRSWLNAVNSELSDLLEVTLEGLGPPAATSGFAGAGGVGGAAGWPGGGGGGGGAGQHRGGDGGPGADGAGLIFEWSNDHSVVDAEVFVTPGQYQWFRPPNFDRFAFNLIGGGGGGGRGSAGG